MEQLATSLKNNNAGRESERTPRHKRRRAVTLSKLDSRQDSSDDVNVSSAPTTPRSEARGSEQVQSESSEDLSAATSLKRQGSKHKTESPRSSSKRTRRSTRSKKRNHGQHDANSKAASNTLPSESPLQQEVEELKQENVQLKEELSRACEESASLKHSNDTLLTEIERLSEQIQEMEQTQQLKEPMHSSSKFNAPGRIKRSRSQVMNLIHKFESLRDVVGSN